MSEWRPLSFPVLMITLACTTGLLAGCGGDEKVADLATPSTEPASSPVVPPYTTTLKLNEEQKKAADEAVVAVGKFQKVVDDVNSQGGNGADAFSAVSTGQARQNNQDEAKAMRKSGQRIVGTTSYENYVVTRVTAEQSSNASANVSTCMRINDAKLVDSSGKDLSKGIAKDSRFNYVVTNKSGRWLVSDEKVDGSGCGEK